MRSAGLRVRWLACLCLAFIGCDGVGRALVQSGSDGKSGDLACRPIDCRDILFEPFEVPEPEAPDLAHCTPALPAVCEPALETEPGLDRDPPGTCRRTLSLDDDAVDPEAIRALSCGKVSLVRAQSGPHATLHIEDASWTQLDLDLETAEPFTLELMSAQLADVRLRMRGPVTLRVRDTDAVHDLVLVTDSPLATVDIQDAEVKAIGLGDPQAEFAGSLSITRSTIAKANIRAHDLQLETVGLKDARITAEHTRWVDVTSRRTKLSVGDALISASRLTEIEVERCALLGLHQTTLSEYAIPTCSDGPTRLFESTLRRGSLQGELDIDQTLIQESIFGMHDATDLLLWSASLTSVNFCAATDHVVVAGKGSFLCAECQELDGTGVPIDACRHEDDKTLILKSCGVFAVAPVCEPTPFRMRPPFN